eukprot:CAMPEP_0179433390 /NCGR_PEP_ID=MMETSP0799-20121207/17812_1 /TAXON_ID=46947 /ORGANISM="Geminigera cryophila, Strain CCMP2564" /LENGTH=169 /DNA_ID=CAMNT_0021211337 /DNA_START=351 /DNA_END=856 /DNA_ORIENTATION=-
MISDQAMFNTHSVLKGGRQPWGRTCQSGCRKRPSDPSPCRGSSAKRAQQRQASRTRGRTSAQARTDGGSCFRGICKLLDGKLQPTLVHHNASHSRIFGTAANSKADSQFGDIEPCALFLHPVARVSPRPARCAYGGSRAQSQVWMFGRNGGRRMGLTCRGSSAKRAQQR